MKKQLPCTDRPCYSVCQWLTRQRNLWAITERYLPILSVWFNSSSKANLSEKKPWDGFKVTHTVEYTFFSQISRETVLSQLYSILCYIIECILKGWQHSSSHTIYCEPAMQTDNLNSNASETRLLQHLCNAQDYTYWSPKSPTHLLNK